MRDLETRNDIKQLMMDFYSRLLEEPSFKVIFFDIAQVEILDHLELMIDFWEFTLFNKGSYQKNIITKHLEIHMEHSLSKDLFEKWLIIFNNTIDNLYKGSNATEAKNRAFSIATVIKLKIDELDKRRLEINN